jgi:hypothetical protein
VRGNVEKIEEELLVGPSAEDDVEE